MKNSIFYKILLSIGVVFLILLEIFIAKLPFEELGDKTSFLYYGLLGLNIIPIIFILLKKHVKYMLALILLISFLTIPYPLYLTNKLIYLKGEAAKVTAYLHHHYIEEGFYPNDLSGYSFTFPTLEKYFNYEIELSSEDSENNLTDDFYMQEFSLTYFIGSLGGIYSYQYDYEKRVFEWRYFSDRLPISIDSY